MENQKIIIAISLAIAGALIFTVPAKAEEMTCDPSGTITEVISSEYQFEASQASVENIDEIKYQADLVEEDIPYTEAVCGTVKVKKALSDEYLHELCEIVAVRYPDISAELLQALCYEESRNEPNIHNGRCVGLCGINTYFNKERAQKLGVTDFYDPFSNILIAADFLEELYGIHGSIEYALLRYNMTADSADSIWNRGGSTKYVRTIIENEKLLKSIF